MVLKENKFHLFLYCLGASVVLFAVNYLTGNELVSAAISGFCFGIIFFIVMLFLTNRKEKQAQALRNRISYERTIICEGPAQVKQKGVNNIAGWMFLSEDAVEFYKASMNMGGSNFAILLDDIVSTSTAGNTLTISTDADTFIFQVQQCKVWKRQIDQEVAK